MSDSNNGNDIEKEEEIQEVNSNDVINKNVILKTDKINIVKIQVIPVNFSE